MIAVTEHLKVLVGLAALFSLPIGCLILAALVERPWRKDQS